MIAPVGVHVPIGVIVAGQLAPVLSYWIEALNPWTFDTAAHDPLKVAEAVPVHDPLENTSILGLHAPPLALPHVQSEQPR